MGSAPSKGTSLGKQVLLPQLCPPYSGFDSPEGTWWMQLTKLLGGEFLANNAYANSHVSYRWPLFRLPAPADPQPGHGGCQPRHHSGLCGHQRCGAHSIDLDKFQRDYREMLDSLKKVPPPMHRSGWVPSLWARNANPTTWIPSP